VVLDQVIELSAERAQAVFADPAFYQTLGSLPSISAPAVLSFSLGHGRAKLILSYHFTGRLSGPARRLLDTSKLTWTQETEIDLSSRRTEVRMVPDHYEGLFSFQGWYALREGGPTRCTQHLEADLTVHLPLLGPLAERAIAVGVRQNLAETARLVERYSANQDQGTGT
jgi:hypothetical protein